MNQNSDKVIISSAIFIATFMALDSIIAGKIDAIPKQAVYALLLVTMLSSLQFVGLGRVAGPFSALIAATVFLTRGQRIFVGLTELSQKEGENTTNE